MFVRVMPDKSNSLVQTIYECEQVHIQPVSNKPGTVLLDIDSGNIILGLLKKSAEIYFMNNEGKTIDTYRWA